MWERPVPTNGFTSAASLVELIYHSTVRNLRKTHTSAVMGLVTQVVQQLTMVIVFLGMFSILGMKTAQIPGADFLLYIMSGVFVYMTHVKAMSAVAGSEGPASAMMQHAPMTTAISIASAALASLYQTAFSTFVLLGLYHLAWTPIHIEDPIGVIAMYLLAWFYGIAVGLVFLAIKPWAPSVVSILTSIYSRANMIFSGKMVLANTTPYGILAFFMWNPLFHCIDQTRGYMFLNYTPHKTSISYAVIVACTMLVIGLMGEFFTRKHASKSWSARS